MTDLANLPLDDMDQAFRAKGIPYVEVGRSSSDYCGASGWRTRGRPPSTGSFNPQGVVCHHTASPTSCSAQDSLNVILWGNGSAPGPISQLFISREPKLYLVAAGRANHAGTGDVNGSGCVDQNARRVGVEVDNCGNGSEYWSDAQVDLYAKTVAALNDYYHYSINETVLHYTLAQPCYPGSKIDPAGPYKLQPTIKGTWDLGTWRNYISTFAGGAPGPTPPTPTPGGGTGLVQTLIKAKNNEFYAVFQGDMDDQGTVTCVRYLGPRVNKIIGFQPDNKTPRLAGTKVLERSQASMTDFTLIGPVPPSPGQPNGDKVKWSNANFYQGD